MMNGRTPWEFRIHFYFSKVYGFPCQSSQTMKDLLGKKVDKLSDFQAAGKWKIFVEIIFTRNLGQELQYATPM